MGAAEADKRGCLRGHGGVNIEHRPRRVGPAGAGALGRGAGGRLAAAPWVGLAWAVVLYDIAHRSVWQTLARAVASSIRPRLWGRFWVVFIPSARPLPGQSSWGVHWALT